MFVTLQRGEVHMKIAVIDDQGECRNEISSCIQRFFSERYKDEKLLIEEFASGEEFLSVFLKDSYELIFIDQYMKSLSGIDTAKQIRLTDSLVPIIFITTSRDHAIDSYQVRATGYLVKPFTYADFENTMLLQDMEKLRNARFINIQEDKVLLREIIWCDMSGHYLQIHTSKKGVLRYRTAFSSIADSLIQYPQFLSCFKGCIVNLDYVNRLDELSFMLKTGDRIIFSNRDRKKIECEYHAYLFQKAREEELL